MRARTSPERLVSWVWVTSRPRGERAARSALAAWKPSTERPEARRVAAHLVEREQAQVAVERGVLDALRGDRRRGLLKARHELVVAALAQREDVGQPPLGGNGDRPEIGLLDATRPRLDVGAVDRQRRQRVGDRLDVQQLAQALHLAREGRRRHLELGARRHLVEGLARRGQPASAASPAGSTNSAAASLRNS
jgi:hypothetical protein